MTLLVMNLALALAWAILTSSMSAGNLFLGFVLGYAALWLVYRAMGNRAGYFGIYWRLPWFLSLFLWDLVLANLRVAYDVITPRHRMRPGVVAVPLEVASDVQLTVLANLITLTPGTVTLDVSEDGRTLYLHVMYLTEPDELRSIIKNRLERRILEMSQP